MKHLSRLTHCFSASQETKGNTKSGGRQGRLVWRCRRSRVADAAETCWHSLRINVPLGCWVFGCSRVARVRFDTAGAPLAVDVAQTASWVVIGIYLYICHSICI